MYEFSMIPTIKKLTRVTKHTATAIDGIVTNCILNSNFKNSIVKTDFSDNFPTIFINEFIQGPKEDMEKYVYRRDFTENAFLCLLSRHYLKHLGIVLKS